MDDMAAQVTEQLQRVTLLAQENEALAQREQHLTRAIARQTRRLYRMQQQGVAPDVLDEHDASPPQALQRELGSSSGAHSSNSGRGGGSSSNSGFGANNGSGSGSLDGAAATGASREGSGEAAHRAASTTAQAAAAAAATAAAEASRDKVTAKPPPLRPKGAAVMDWDALLDAWVKDYRSLLEEAVRDRLRGSTITPLPPDHPDVHRADNLLLRVSTFPSHVVSLWWQWGVQGRQSGARAAMMVLVMVAVAAVVVVILLTPATYALVPSRSRRT